MIILRSLYIYCAKFQTIFKDFYNFNSLTDLEMGDTSTSTSSADGYPVYDYFISENLSLAQFIQRLQNRYQNRGTIFAVF
jgi:hypothetical protein